MIQISPVLRTLASAVAISRSAAKLFAFFEGIAVRAPTLFLSKSIAGAGSYDSYSVSSSTAHLHRFSEFDVQFPTSAISSIASSV